MDMRWKNPQHSYIAAGLAVDPRSPRQRASFVAIATAMACGSLPLMALDANNDGISDVWASLYPVAAANPHADHDGDGISNLEEAFAWTNPNNADSFFRTDFNHNGSTFEIDFNSIRWQRYRIMRSSDLSNWTRDAPERLSNGSPIFYSETATAPRRFFHAHCLPSLNSDTDALSNLEEEILGTDPLKWDTDGDKVPDCVEFLMGTNPLSNVDSDGDGLPDDWERWIINFVPSDNVTDLSHVNQYTDFDGDGVLDGEEFVLGTNPTVKRRHIVFFMTEDQGYHLGCYGTQGLNTPNIDSLASQGVLFHRAFTGGSVCSVGKMSLLTSTLPQAHSGYRNTSNYSPYSGGQSRYPLPTNSDPSSLSTGGIHEDLPTLIEILRDRGWFTMITHKTHTEPVRKFPYSHGGPSCDNPTAARNNIQTAIAQAGKRPMFIILSVGSPHLPFAPLANNNNEPDITGPVEIPNCYPTNHPDVRQNFVDYYRSIQVLDRIYHAAVDEMQDQPDTAIGGASPPSLGASTLFVYTSDHGIGLHRGKQSAYGMGFHVPLVMHGHGVSTGIELDTPISHIDLAPTFLAWDGIAKPPSMIGKNLWPLLQGNATTIAGRSTIMTSNHHRYDARAVTDGRFYYIRNLTQPTGSWNNPGPSLNADQYTAGSPWFNLTYDACKNSPQNEKPYQFLDQLVNGKLPPEELYDMETDLWMVNNLIDEPTHTATLSTLRAEMTRWRNLTEDYNTSNNELSRRTIRYQEPGTTSGGGGENPDAGNGIINSSFESSTADWTWTGGSSAHFAVENNPSLATHGTFIANIRGLHSATDNSGLTQLANLDAVTGSYTLTFDASKAPNGAAASSLNVRIYRASPATILAQGNFTLTADMQTFTLPLSIPADLSGKLGVRFLPNGNGDAGNRVAIDSIRLEPDSTEP